MTLDAIRKTILPLVAVSFLIAAPFFSVKATYADELLQRSVTIARSNPAITTEYEFAFQYATNTPMASFTLRFCDNSPLFTEPCTTPAGLDTTAAVLTSQTGEVGFTEDVTTNGLILMSRLSSPADPIAVTYNFDDILNPSNTGTVFVRIENFASSDGTGAAIDRGAVAYSIQPDVNLSAFVPPRLEFCFGEVVALDCSTSSGQFLELGEFTATDTSTANAEFAVGTNSVTGYNVQLAGSTLTSGNNIINPLTTPGVSSQGVSQFGFNLRSNSVPNLGVNPTGVGTGVPTARYNSIDLFTFTDGDLIATSPLSTEFNKFTMSFVANIDEDQAVGIYASTITLIAFANF